MDLLTGYLTAPRPIPTLSAALASLHESGFPSPSSAHNDVARAGNLRAFQRVAHELITLSCATARNWILIFEDDVTWQPDSFARLREIVHAQPRVFDDNPTYGVLSLHCTRKVSHYLELSNGSERGKLCGVYESRLGVNTWGAQALLFTRDSLYEVINSRLFSDRIRTHRTGLDSTIFGALKELRLRAWYLLPCLARHTLGETNSGLVNGTPHELRGCDY